MQLFRFRIANGWLLKSIKGVLFLGGCCSFFFFFFFFFRFIFVCYVWFVGFVGVCFVCSGNVLAKRISLVIIKFPGGARTYRHTYPYM